MTGELKQIGHRLITASPHAYLHLVSRPMPTVRIVMWSHIMHWAYYRSQLVSAEDICCL